MNNGVMVSHEMPLCLMNSIGEKVNDYTYILLHRYLEDPLYKNVIMGSPGVNGDPYGWSYLDNSCYELGASLSNEVLYKACQEIKPSVVILPDVLGNASETFIRTKDFIEQYPETIEYGMAVIQGNTFDEMVECYQTFRDFRDAYARQFFMIGIPFVFSWVDKKPSVQAAERVRLLKYLNDNRVIDKNRWHHLLGTWQAFEFAFYRNYNWIRSIDTSNPIMAAIDGNRYEEGIGLTEKPIATFDSTFHMPESAIDMDLVYHNCSEFRIIVNGGRDGRG